MDEQTINELDKLMKAVRAFSKSVERIVLTGQAEDGGAATMMIKNYRSLHKRAADLLPDDYYITDTLALDINENAADGEVIAQVRLASNQLRLYLDDLVRGETAPFEGANDWGTLGRDLQSHVLNITKHTLKRALSNIDIRVSGGDEEGDEFADDAKPKRRVRIEIDREDEA